MANVKITELTALTDPASSDVLPIVDVGADTTKKVTIADLLENAGDGTAATPAFSFDNDKSVGMWRPGSEQLAFSTSGTTRLFINSSGNIGIGTTSPTDKLTISSGSNQIGLDTGDQSTYGTLDLGHFANGAFIGTVAGSNAASNVLRLGTSGTEQIRVDSTGRLLVGHSSAITTTPIGAAQVQVIGTNNPSSQLSISRFSNDSDRPRLSFIKSRSGTKGTNTIVQNNDNLGDIMFMGADGSATNDYIIGAFIGAAVDGTPGADDMPSRIFLATTASGSSSPSERMRISNAGVVTINSGFVTLNGSKVGGIQVTIADDAFAEITPPKAGAGFVAVTEGPDEVFPNSPCHGFVYCDWGDSPDVANVHLGSAFETSNLGPPTGTTGSDDHATLFAGGTSGKVYLENRLGTQGIFALTFT